MKRHIVQHWPVGWNLRGYLPDPETVVHGLSLEHAVDYLAAEIAHVGDFAASEFGAREYSRAWNEVQDWDLTVLERLAVVGGDNGTAHWAVEVDNHFYWVMPCFALNCNHITSERI